MVCNLFFIIGLQGDKHRHFNHPHQTCNEQCIQASETLSSLPTLCLFWLYLWKCNFMSLESNNTKIEAHIAYIYTHTHIYVFYVYFLSNSSVLHFIKVSVYDRLGEKKKKWVLYHRLFEKYCPRILWILWPILHVTYFLF